MQAPPPNVDLHADKSGLMVRAVMVCGMLAGLAMVGRIVSRGMVKAGFFMSDLLLIIGLLSAWVVDGLGVWAAKLGIGKHIWVVDPTHYPVILKIVLADEIMYAFSLTCTKISILLLYHSIFPGNLRNGAFTRVLLGLGIFCVCWGVCLFFVALFDCVPVNGFWDAMTMKTPPRCTNNRAWYIALAVPNITVDMAILSVPVTKVWRLKMSRMSKIAVSGTFLCGGVAVICSIVRMGFIVKTSNADFTWSFYKVVVWSSAEVNIAVVSACIPTMRPLLQKLLPPSTTQIIRGIADRSGKSGGKYSDSGNAYNLSKSSRVKSEFHPLNDSQSRLEEASVDGGTNDRPGPIAAVYKPGGVPVRKITSPGEIHRKNMGARYDKA